MKKFVMLFVVCLAALGFQASFADDADDIARAAKRGASAPAASTASGAASARQRSEAPAVSGAGRSAGSTGVAASSSARATNPRAGTAAVEKARTTAPSVVSRTAAVQSRAATSQKTADRVRGVARDVVQPAGGVSARTAVGAGTRSALVGRSAARQPTATTRGASANSTAIRARASVARAALNPEAAAAIASTDYKKCREVFYSCMDEFCAAKDTQLKRCACSSRMHEFDGIKNRMGNIEDKILTFNERLLTVNMDKEDAAAIIKATEGETAYQQDDKSASKKVLDEIAKKLRSNTADTDLTRNLSSISLSLDLDSAFDSVDSMAGASTTTKEGTALYNAAVPVCRDMVAEVCDADGSSMAESAYLMAIEQDCNTVAKAYSTMQDQALEKVREGSALLDMARLDIHQQRNSDDILTCKKKMLDALSGTSVCGDGLGKCLDTTGRYIDPLTGEAFLTAELVNLGNLITRPSGNEKWMSVPNNGSFVAFLNSKKKYLEPSMESCQDISASVWDAFVEDALAQIKLAQERKLEDMRQSCTSLTTKCLAQSAKSISDFDARALSVFGVSADVTVNAMCDGVKTACHALLETGAADAGDWAGGMSDIATDKTYATIMQTCTEIGKNCIIQNCKSISGNFGLCESIDRSVNRHEILSHEACWKDVRACVASAGNSSIDNIFNKFNWNIAKDSVNDLGRMYSYSSLYDVGDGVASSSSSTGKYYHVTSIDSNGAEKLFCSDVAPNITSNNGMCTHVFDTCFQQCELAGKDPQSQIDCKICRLTEKIWGNCEYDSYQRLEDVKDKLPDQNMILKPQDNLDTLMWWFAKNTNTSQSKRSCSVTCPRGYIKAYHPYSGTTSCVRGEFVYEDMMICEGGSTIEINKTIDGVEFRNCCPTGKLDKNGNCCMGGLQTREPNYYYDLFVFEDPFTTGGVCIGGAEISFAVNYKDSSEVTLVCIGDVSGEDVNNVFPNGQTVKCDGRYVRVERNGNYLPPAYDSVTYKTNDDKYDVSTNRPLAYSYYVDARDGEQTYCYFGCAVGYEMCGGYSIDGINVDGFIEGLNKPSGKCPGSGNKLLIRFPN
jgi:hypothetical protein